MEVLYGPKDLGKPNFIISLFNKAYIKPIIFFDTGVSSQWWDNSLSVQWLGPIIQLECLILSCP
jgi:hypothetical protein